MRRAQRDGEEEEEEEEEALSLAWEADALDWGTGRGRPERVVTIATRCFGFGGGEGSPDQTAFNGTVRDITVWATVTLWATGVRGSDESI